MKKILIIISMMVTFSISILYAEDRRNIIAVGDFTATDGVSINYTDSLRECIIKCIKLNGCARVVDMRHPNPYAALFEECSEPNFEGKYLARNEKPRKEFCLSGHIDSILVSEHQEDTEHYTARIKYSIEIVERGCDAVKRYSLEHEFIPKPLRLLPTGMTLLGKDFFYQYSPEQAINEVFAGVNRSDKLSKILNEYMLIPAQIKLLKSKKKYGKNVCIVNLGLDNISSQRYSSYISVYEKRCIANIESIFRLFNLRVLELIDERHVICSIEKRDIKHLKSITDNDIIYIGRRGSLTIIF